MGKAKYCIQCGLPLKSRDWAYCSESCYEEAFGSTDSDYSGGARRARGSDSSRRRGRSSGNGSYRRRPDSSRNSYGRASPSGSSRFSPPNYPPPQMPYQPSRNHFPPAGPYYAQNAYMPDMYYGMPPPGGGGGPWYPSNQYGHHPGYRYQEERGRFGQEGTMAMAVAGATLAGAGLQAVATAGCLSCTIM